MRWQIISIQAMKFILADSLEQRESAIKQVHAKEQGIYMCKYMYKYMCEV